MAFLVAVATAAASPAGAVTRDVVRLAEGQTVSRDYPDMGPAAGTENETALPAVCEASPTCDLIPLTIVLPADYSPSNDFAIQIRLDWETEQLPNDQGQANDLDLFLWGLDEEGGDELIARSVGTRVPEIVGAGQPDKGDYKVTVRNSLGYNAGYKLTFRWISGRIDLPEESEDPGRPAFTPGEDEPPRVAPPPAGGRAQPVFGEGSAAAPPAWRPHPDAARRRTGLRRSRFPGTWSIRPRCPAAGATGRSIPSLPTQQSTRPGRAPIRNGVGDLADRGACGARGRRPFVVCPATAGGAEFQRRRDEARLTPDAGSVSRSTPAAARR